MDIDLARKDEIPQEFTSEQIANIKANMPTQMANVCILNQIYSPEETKIGVWREYRTVDNEQVLMEKPVYTKMIIGTLPSSSSNVNIQLGSGAYEPFVISGSVKSTEGYMIPVNYAGNDKFGVAVYSDGSKMWVNVSETTKSRQYTLYVGYAKTTDAWETVV